MKRIVILLLERIPRTRWWSKRMRRERALWLDSLTRLPSGRHG